MSRQSVSSQQHLEAHEKNRSAIRRRGRSRSYSRPPNSGPLNRNRNWWGACNTDGLWGGSATGTSQ